jgi:release factor glutamine methyltransferase
MSAPGSDEQRKAPRRALGESRGTQFEATPSSPRPTTVADALRHARALGVERLDGQLLLAHLLGRPRSWLLAHDDAALDADQAGALQAALKRRAAGEPLAYLIGEKEFHGLVLEVNPSVLIPRPDTEVLVEWAIELLTAGWAGVPNACIVDLGTGSGAIALAVKHAHPQASVSATDISAAALAVARVNAQRLGLDVTLHTGAWWTALEDQRFHLALSNPPYIAGGDPHLAALLHEPMLALSPGGDGLDAMRQVIVGAPDHLHPGGWLLLEHGHDQAAAINILLQKAGFAGIKTRHDLGGQARCTGGRYDAA